MRPSLTALDCRRHRVDAADQDVGAAPRLHDVGSGQRHVVIVEERRVDLRIFRQIGFPEARGLRDVPIGRLGVEHLDAGKLLDDVVEALGAALRAGMAERALRHDDLALAAHGVAERLRHRGAHELVVGSEEGVDVDLVERSNQRVHVDHGRAGVDHLLHGLGEGADAEGLDRDEIPFLRGHVVDRGALLHRIELAVEPGDFDVEQLAPEFRGLLALRTPGSLEAGVGERRLQRLLRSSDFSRQCGVYAHAAEDGSCGAGGRCRLKKIAPRRREIFRPGHRSLP
ncbi:hypothetical protein ACVIQT_006603 [Bradyrhizobium diazoefficiens]